MKLACPRVALCLLSLATALFALGFAGQAQVQAAASSDPALCNPIFDKFARLHPAGWEQRTDPSIQPMIGWQRLIDCGATGTASFGATKGAGGLADGKEPLR